MFRPGTLLIALLLGYSLAAVAAVGAWVWLEREQALAHAEDTASRAARLFEERLVRSLEMAEFMTQRVAMRVAEASPAAGGLQHGLRQQLSGMLKAAPGIGTVYVLDPAGRVILDLRGFYVVGTSLAERDWVQGLNAGQELTYGRLEFEDATRSHAFTVARRVVGQGGAVIAQVAATVEIEGFRPFLGELDRNQSPSLGVARPDGAVLLRQPLRAEDVGRSLAGGKVLTASLAETQAGIVRAGDGRILAYRQVAGRRLVAWVGLDEDQALAEWRRLAVTAFGLLALALVVAGGAASVVVAEIGRERRMAGELEAVNRDLKRSNADLEQFAYSASHDLKEPLRNIASYVQLLQRRYQGKLDADADAYIGYTVDGVRRLQTIINELLAYSRIGTAKLSLVPVQSGASLSAALSALKRTIAEVQAVVDVAGPLPVVLADGTQLISLFQNLVGNGLKYRREEVRPEITVGCEDKGDQWAFFVRDNGIGIDPQYHDQVFEVFKRLHPRGRYSGTGIGLAICKRVVERHGGRIWLDSKPGVGSTFWFTLPKVG